MREGYIINYDNIFLIYKQKYCKINQHMRKYYTYKPYHMRDFPEYINEIAEQSSVFNQEEKKQIAEIITEFGNKNNFQFAIVRCIARSILRYGVACGFLYICFLTLTQGTWGLTGSIIMFLFLTLIWFVFTVYVPNIYVWKFHFSLSYINPHQKLLDTINVDLIKKIGYFLGEHAQLDIKNVSGVRTTLSNAISTIANQLANRSLFSSTDTLVKKQLGVSSKHTTYNTYAITWTEPMRFQFMEFAARSASWKWNNSTPYSYYYLLSYTANNKMFLPEDDFIVIKRKIPYYAILIGYILGWIIVMYSLPLLFVGMTDKTDTMDAVSIIQPHIFFLTFLWAIIGFFAWKRIYYRNLVSTWDEKFDKIYRVECRDEHTNVSLINPILKTDLLSIQWWYFSHRPTLYISWSTASIARNFWINGLFKMWGCINKQQYAKKLFGDLENIKQLSLLLLKHFH